MRPRRTAMPLDRAEEIALSGLTFLAADGARLVRFLSLTGLGPDDLRGALADPTLLAATLEHILGDEPLLLELAANRNLPPEDIERAWDVLTLEAARRTRP